MAGRFLDVSPVGNTYTAGLDAETVRYLQETARSSRTASGDAPATEPAIYTDGDGAVYPNLCARQALHRHRRTL